MSHSILVTGAAGGQQGSIGRHIANLLIEQGAEVRALVHKPDARSDGLPPPRFDGICLFAKALKLIRFRRAA
jgi:nucleoside-diphosphate-sugar epimerase